PAPKFSQANMSMPRAPNSDHIAISMAPVSEPATMPTRQSGGTPRIAHDRSTTSTSRESPAAERGERPTSADDKAAAHKPGRFAPGPDEKQGLTGRRTGFIALFLAEGCGRPGLTAVVRRPHRNLSMLLGEINAARQRKRGMMPKSIRRIALLTTSQESANIPL